MRREKPVAKCILSEPHKVGFGAIAAIILMLPGLLFSRLKVTDGFLYQIIAYVQLTLSGDHLGTLSQGGYSFAFVEFLPGYPLLLSLFSRLGAIQPVQLQFMPIAGLFLPLFYYALTQKLFRSRTLSILLAVYSAYDIGLASHYNVFAYTWSNLFYLGFLLVSLRLIDKRRPGDLVILYIIFFGSLFMHYTVSAWLIILVSVLNLCFFIKDRRSPVYQSGGSRGSLAMPVTFLIAYLSFNQIFFRVWVPSLRQSMTQSDNPFQLFMAKFAIYLGFDTSVPEPYRLLNPWNQALGQWRTTEYLLILIPVALWFIKLFHNWFNKRSDNLKHPYYLELAMAIGVTTLVDWFIYGAHSGINMRYVTLCGPFLMVIALHQLCGRRWVQAAVVAALVLAAMAAYLNAVDHYLHVPPTRLGHIETSAEWFFAHNTGEIILSDLETTGQYLVAGAKGNEELPRVLAYDEELYAGVVEPESCESTPDDLGFVIVDAYGIEKPLHGTSNRIYEPLSRYLDRIVGNPCLNRVYDDGSVWLLSRREQAP